MLVAEGLAETQRHRDDDEKSPRYDELCAAEVSGTYIYRWCKINVMCYVFIRYFSVSVLFSESFLGFLFMFKHVDSFFVLGRTLGALGSNCFITTTALSN